MKECNCFGRYNELTTRLLKILTETHYDDLSKEFRTSFCTKIKFLMDDMEKEIAKRQEITLELPK